MEQPSDRALASATSPLAVYAQLEDYPVAAEGIELLGFHVSVIQRSTEAWIAVMIEYMVAVQALQRHVGKAGHNDSS